MLWNKTEKQENQLPIQSFIIFETIHSTVSRQMIKPKVELLVLNSNTWNHLNVCKQMITNF